MTQQRETVTIRDGAFEPRRLSVPAGTAVEWRNDDDDADHRIVSVRFDDAASAWSFRSQSLRPGDSVVYAFDDDGVYEYFCRIVGEDMCGAVLVGDADLDDPLPCEDES